MIELKISCLVLALLNIIVYCILSFFTKNSKFKYVCLSEFYLLMFVNYIAELIISISTGRQWWIDLVMIIFWIIISYVMYGIIKEKINNEKTNTKN